MHLKKRVLNISKAVFDEKTYVEDGFLHINKQELVDQLQDFNFKSIDVELVHPGERCRINNVADCVQPMYKLGKGASTFPGVVDDIKRVGTGETVVLRGVSVTEVALRPVLRQRPLAGRHDDQLQDHAYPYRPSEPAEDHAG